MAAGTLSPKVKEFVYIAFDTAATHLYVKGLKLHIENAIGYGANAAGDPRGHGDRQRARHPCHDHGGPILAEEAARFEGGG